MKLFTTPALKRFPETHNLYNFNDFYYLVAHKLPPNASGDYRYWVCLDTTRLIFNLPLNTTKVWFEFYDRPGVDRWLVEVFERNYWGDTAVLFIDGARVFVFKEMVRYLIRRLKREKVYVACWYEEEEGLEQIDE